MSINNFYIKTEEEDQMINGELITVRTKTFADTGRIYERAHIDQKRFAHGLYENYDFHGTPLHVGIMDRGRRLGYWIWDRDTIFYLDMAI